MVIYFVPFVSFLLLALISPLVERSQMRLLFFLGVLGCIFLAGLRYECDNDFDNYLQIFESIPPLTRGWDAFASAVFGLYLEPSFALLVSISKVVMPEQGVFLLIAAVSLLLYFRTFNRATIYPALAFFIYLGDGFYLREFTQIRFGLAVSLGFAGMAALYEGRVWKQRWFIALACLFHFTSIMLLTAQIWVRLIRTRRMIFVLSTLLFLLAICGVFNGLIEALAEINLAPQRILDYLGTDEAEHVSIITLVATYGILLWMTWVIQDDEREFYWVSLYALSFAFLCLFSGFDLMRRVSFFFSVAIYVVAPIALQRGRTTFVMLVIAYSSFLFSARLNNILYEYHNWLFY